MDCPSCGHANEPGYAYCEECGSTLEAGSSSGAAGSVCPACRHHNPPEHTYCEECGAALATPEPADTRPCPACHHHNPPEHTYCEECGAALATPEPADTRPCPACHHHNPPEHTYCEECGIALGAPALVAAAPGLDTQPAADPARATWWQWAAVVVIVGGIGAAIAASVLWDRDGDPPSTEAAPAPTAQEASTTLPPTTPPPAAGQDPAATVPTGTLLDLDRLPSPEDARTCEDLADAAVVFLDLTVDVYDRIQAGDRSRALALDYAELARLGDEYAAHAAGFDCTDEEMEGLLCDRIGPPDGGDIRSMLMWAAIPGDAAFTDVGDEEGSHG